MNKAASFGETLHIDCQVGVTPSRTLWAWNWFQYVEYCCSGIRIPRRRPSSPLEEFYLACSDLRNAEDWVTTECLWKVYNGFRAETKGRCHAPHPTSDARYLNLSRTAHLLLQIRQVNVDAERSKNERFEKERQVGWFVYSFIRNSACPVWCDLKSMFDTRQALLRFGETILVKRKRVFDNSRLEDKVAKVRQEEEERIRADVANKAARNALGERIHSRAEEI